MNIYLLRHATAKKRNLLKYPNDDRPLTAQGAIKMRKIAKGISRICPKTDLIISSPLKRSRQTAKILLGAVDGGKRVKISRDLLPGSAVSKKISLIRKYKSNKNIFLVGHEPDLSQLLAKLLGVNSVPFEFKKGAVALTMLGNGKKCILIDFLSPKVLIRLGAKNGYKL